MVMILAALVPAMSTADDQALCLNKTPPCGKTWGALHEDLAYFSAIRTNQHAPGGHHLRGIVVTAGDTGPWGPRSVLSGAFGYWLSVEQSTELDVYGIGLHFAGFDLPFGPFRIGPRVGAGVEYRTAGPDPGFAGVLLLGGEMGVWFGRRVKMLGFADRHFNQPGETSNRVGFELRLHFSGSLLD